MSKKNKDDWRTEIEGGHVRWKSTPSYDDRNALKRFNPKNRGHSFAVADPKVDDESALTADELEMLADVNVYVTDLRDWFEHGVGAIRMFIQNNSADADTSNAFGEIEAEFDSSRRKCNRKFEDENKRAYKDMAQAERELRVFKIENGLKNRPASYPDSTLYHFAIIFAALVAESVANAYFFGQASDTGLLGGFFTAMIVSLANVSLSVVAGFLFLRQINHISMSHKVIGVVGFSAMIFVLALLHLSIAHYREILTRNPDGDLILTALSSMWADPFGLQDLESFLLIAIGSVISVVGIWKGYTLDDRYPGYGAVYKNWKLKDDDMIEMEGELKNDVGGAFDKAVSDSHAILQRLKGSQRELETLEGEIGGYLRGAETVYENARAAAINMISTYRSAVQEVLNDQSRFPYSDALVEGEFGLDPLDPDNQRESIQKLLSGKITNIKTAIENYPDNQQQFVTRLEEARVSSTSSQAISGTKSSVAEEYDHVLDRLTGDES